MWTSSLHWIHHWMSQTAVVTGDKRFRRCHPDLHNPPSSSLLLFLSSPSPVPQLQLFPPLLTPSAPHSFRPPPSALRHSCSSILPAQAPSPPLFHFFFFLLLLLLSLLLSLHTQVSQTGTPMGPHLKRCQKDTTAHTPKKKEWISRKRTLFSTTQKKCVTYLHTSPLPWSWLPPPPCRLWSSLQRPPPPPWPWRTPSSVHPFWATRQLGSPAPNGPGWLAGLLAGAYSERAEEMM